MKTNHAVLKKGSYEHVGCGGQISCGGFGTKSLPIGFGFSNSNRFQVDVIKYKIVVGACMKCKVGFDKDADFVVGKGKYITKFPRKINAMIKAVRS